MDGRIGLLDRIHRIDNCRSTTASKYRRSNEHVIHSVAGLVFLVLVSITQISIRCWDWILLGTVIIPGLAFTALLVAPWLDQGLERRPAKRPVAISFMLLGILSVFYLTWESVQTTHWDQVHAQGELQIPGEGPEIDTAAPGYEIYSAQSCVNCHGQNLEGGAAAPALVGTQYTAEEIAIYSYLVNLSELMIRSTKFPLFVVKYLFLGLYILLLTYYDKYKIN